MDLIERYIHAVTRHLPATQREDVANELRTTIEEMALDRAAGKKPTHKDIKAALIELGNPDILAAKYNYAPRYLIGSKWYDTYLRLLKQLLSSVPPIVVTVVLLIKLAEQNAVAASVVDAIGAAINVGIHIFFWVTLGFVIAERSGVDPDSMRQKATTAWKPSDLPALPKTREIRDGDVIAGIVCLLVGAIFLVLGFHTKAWAGDATSVLNPAIWVPWGVGMLGLIIVSIMQEFYKLKIGKWTLGIAAFNVLLNVATIALVVQVFKTQDVLNPSFVNSAKNINIDTVGQIIVILTTVFATMNSLSGIRKALRSKRQR